MNLEYVIRIRHKIYNKGTMSQWQIQVTIFLSGTDVIYVIVSTYLKFYLGLLSKCYKENQQISLNSLNEINLLLEIKQV